MTTPKDGFIEFRRNVYPAYKFLFKRLGRGQSPHTIFITCSDSRIDPCLITQSKPGDLFVIRNAGNIVPRWQGKTSGEIASVAFALKVLKVPRLIVCGHSDCGAMKAAMNPSQSDDVSITDWLSNCEELTERAKREHICLETAAKQNVLQQIQHLKEYPAVKERFDAGELHIEGWYYDIGVGECDVYCPAKDRWLSAFEASADDLDVSA